MESIREKALRMAIDQKPDATAQETIDRAEMYLKFLTADDLIGIERTRFKASGSGLAPVGSDDYDL